MEHVPSSWGGLIASTSGTSNSIPPFGKNGVHGKTYLNNSPVYDNNFEVIQLQIQVQDLVVRKRNGILTYDGIYVSALERHAIGRPSQAIAIALKRVMR